MATSKKKKKLKVQSKLPIHEPSSEIPSGTFWTTRIEPGVPTVLGKNTWQGAMVMKNYGPGKILVDTGIVHMELLPGSARVMRTHTDVEVKIIDEKSALLEFEYMPNLK